MACLKGYTIEQLKTSCQEEDRCGTCLCSKCEYEDEQCMKGCFGDVCEGGWTEKQVKQSCNETNCDTCLCSRCDKPREGKCWFPCFEEY